MGAPTFHEPPEKLPRLDSNQDDDINSVGCCRYITGDRLSLPDKCGSL